VHTWELYRDSQVIKLQIKIYIVIISSWWSTTYLLCFFYLWQHRFITLDNQWAIYMRGNLENSIIILYSQNHNIQPCGNCKRAQKHPNIYFIWARKWLIIYNYDLNRKSCYLSTLSSTLNIKTMETWWLLIIYTEKNREKILWNFVFWVKNCRVMMVTRIHADTSYLVLLCLLSITSFLIGSRNHFVVVLPP